jgi:hypothetical protein
VIGDLAQKPKSNISKIKHLDMVSVGASPWQGLSQQGVILQQDFCSNFTTSGGCLMAPGSAWRELPREQ